MRHPGQPEPRGTEQRWWLEAGRETCAFCAARYHVEAACYCAECDRPMCPGCVVEIFITRQSVCPDCGI